MDNNYTDGSLTIQADIRNFGKKTAKGYKVCYSLYANKLYSDENEPVILARDTKGAAIRNSVVAQVEPITTGNTQEAEKVVLKVKNPNKWSAETPYRYTLIAELKDHKNRSIETVSTIVGFRKVEIKDTPADQDEFGLEIGRASCRERV